MTVRALYVAASILAIAALIGALMGRTIETER